MKSLMILETQLANTTSFNYGLPELFRDAASKHDSAQQTSSGALLAGFRDLRFWTCSCARPFR